MMWIVFQTDEKSAVPHIKLIQFPKTDYRACDTITHEEVILWCTAWKDSKSTFNCCYKRINFFATHEVPRTGFTRKILSI